MIVTVENNRVTLSDMTREEFAQLHVVAGSCLPGDGDASPMHRALTELWGAAEHAEKYKILDKADWQRAFDATDFVLTVKDGIVVAK